MLNLRLVERLKAARRLWLQARSEIGAFCAEVIAGARLAVFAFLALGIVQSIPTSARGFAALVLAIILLTAPLVLSA